MLKVKTGFPEEKEIDGNKIIAENISKKFKGHSDDNSGLLHFFIRNLRYLSCEELEYLISKSCREYQRRNHAKEHTTFMR